MDSNKSNLQTLLQEKQQQTEKLSININQLRVSLAVVDFKHCHKVDQFMIVKNIHNSIRLFICLTKILSEMGNV